MLQNDFRLVSPSGYSRAPEGLQRLFCRSADADAQFAKMRDGLVRGFASKSAFREFLREWKVAWRRSTTSYSTVKGAFAMPLLVEHQDGGFRVLSVAEFLIRRQSRAFIWLFNNFPSQTTAQVRACDAFELTSARLKLLVQCIQSTELSGVEIYHKLSVKPIVEYDLGKFLNLPKLIFDGRAWTTSSKVKLQLQVLKNLFPDKYVVTERGHLFWRGDGAWAVFKDPAVVAGAFRAALLKIFTIGGAAARAVDFLQNEHHGNAWRELDACCVARPGSALKRPALFRRKHILLLALRIFTAEGVRDPPPPPPPPPTLSVSKQKLRKKFNEFVCSRIDLDAQKCVTFRQFNAAFSKFLGRSAKLGQRGESYAFLKRLVQQRPGLKFAQNDFKGGRMCGHRRKNVVWGCELK